MPAPHTVHLQRILRAPPERVYRAFLDASAQCKWLPPGRRVLRTPRPIPHHPYGKDPLAEVLPTVYKGGFPARRLPCPASPPVSQQEGPIAGWPSSPWQP